MKQIRLAILHNGLDKSVDCAKEVFNNIKDDVRLVNIYDERPIRDIMPIRVVPSVSVVLFADTLEECKDIQIILSQLNLLKKQDEVSDIVDELINIAGEIPENLSNKILDTFYSE